LDPRPKALAVRRWFWPAHERRDARDHDLIIELLARVLEPTSVCLDVGARFGGDDRGGG
jgi:hypothetical protein